MCNCFSVGVKVPKELVLVNMLVNSVTMYYTDNSAELNAFVEFVNTCTNCSSPTLSLYYCL